MSKSGQLEGAMTIKTGLIILTLTAAGIATQAAAAGDTITVTLEADATPAEAAAIKRTETKGDPDMLPVWMGHADLNGDHRPDLIFRTRDSALCGAANGCATEAILATPDGYARRAIALPNIGDGDAFLLPTMHNGMHDLRFQGDGHVLTWDGKAYR
jgi:hypothetical protein